MNAIKKFALALFLSLFPAGCSEEKTSQENAPQTSTVSNSQSKADYVLAFSWQPAFCEGASGKRECRTQTKERFDATHFALHGVWPQPGNNVYCDVSQSQIALDKQGRWNKIKSERIESSIWAELKQVMPGTLSSLQKHEWLKHGTCYGGSIDEYYSDSIWLMKQVNRSALQSLFESRVGKSVTFAEIKASFEESFGKGAGDRLRVSCRRDQNSNRQLITEITLGLSGDIASKSGFADYIFSAGPTDPGCPEGIVDPVGLQ